MMEAPFCLAHSIFLLCILIAMSPHFLNNSSKSCDKLQKGSEIIFFRNSSFLKQQENNLQDLHLPHREQQLKKDFLCLTQFPTHHSTHKWLFDKLFNLVPLNCGREREEIKNHLMQHLGQISFLSLDFLPCVFQDFVQKYKETKRKTKKKKWTTKSWSKRRVFFSLSFFLREKRKREQRNDDMAVSIRRATVLSLLPFIFFKSYVSVIAHNEDRFMTFWQCKMQTCVVCLKIIR